MSINILIAKKESIVKKKIEKKKKEKECQTQGGSENYSKLKKSASQRNGNNYPLYLAGTPQNTRRYRE